MGSVRDPNTTDTNGFDKEDMIKAAKAQAKAAKATTKATAKAEAAKAKAKADEAAAKAKAKAETEAVKAAKAKAKSDEAAAKDAAKAAIKAAKEAEAEAAAKAAAEAGARAGSARDKELAQLNSEYQVVKDAGRVRVMSFERYEQIEGRTTYVRLVPSFLSFADFANLHQNRTVTAFNGKEVELGSWWLHHPDRLTYDGLVFQPGAAKVIGGKLNLWRGWGVQPAPGNWQLMADHLRIVMTAGNEEMYDYAIKWLAWTVQHPAEQAEVALVFRGGKGTGKGALGKVICRLFGQHAIHISNAKHLTGFNQHMRDCCFMFADEAYWPGDLKAEGDLKRMVTEPTLFIEGKRKDGITVPNMLHVLMASNSDWIVPASEGERRWVVNEVSDVHMQEAAWFEPLFKQMEEGGAGAMLYDLLNYNLGDFHPRKLPADCGLHDQQMRSLSPLDSWWLELLEIGSLTGCDPDQPNRARSGDYEEKVVAEYEEHGHWVKRPGLYSQARVIEPRLRGHTSDHQLGRYLAKAGCDNSKRVCRKTGWTFPELADCRAAWEKRFPSHVWRNPGIVEWRSEDHADDRRTARERRDDAYEASVKAEQELAEAEADVAANKAEMKGTKF